MKKKLLATAASLALVLGACAQNSPGGVGTKTVVGAGAGAAAGGLIASQVGGGAAGIAAGVLLGGLLGGAIGNALDQRDREYALQAQQQAYGAPIGQTISWNNPQSGNSGTYTPVRDGYNQNGRYCREFQQTIVVGGKVEEGYGIACRQPDGSWEIVQ
jgi:surface antigen